VNSYIVLIVFVEKLFMRLYSYVIDNHFLYLNFILNNG